MSQTKVKEITMSFINKFPEDKELKRLKQGLQIHLSWVRKYYTKYKGVYL